MPSSRVVRVGPALRGASADALAAGTDLIRKELGLEEEFPSPVEEAAKRASDDLRSRRVDRTDLPVVTIDPEGSRDLDQAVHLVRSGSGYRVHYAIADVAAFVPPGGPVDREAHRRGETVYGAGSKIPLHPRPISEDAGSLLSGVDRPALLWTLDLDDTGLVSAARVERAVVRSRAQLSYAQAQRAIDSGTADPVFTLLGQVGELRLAQESARGGVSLPLPEQEVDLVDGAWTLTFRALLPVERWNAQISLMTGMAAADLMVGAGVGLVRVLPPAADRDLARMRRTARALGLTWPSSMRYSDFVRTLDPTVPAQASMVDALTRLLRGSGYRWFDGEVPAERSHAALAADYAHVTAPLRRLVDRYALEVCVSVCAGVAVPEWVREAGPGLPETMRESGRRAGQFERALLDLVEAEVLAPHVGDRFAGVVVDVDDRDDRRGDVVVQEPAVEARVTSSQPLPLGEAVDVTLVRADPAARVVEFAWER